MYKEEFAARIKKARDNTGLTQREVEKETKIPHSTISKYEMGTIEPDLERLGILAAFHDVSIDWLLGFPQKINNKQNQNDEIKESHS